MKKLSIILIGVLVALAACTKSKEVHPEFGDGNDEIVTVGMKDVHVEYMRTDIAELQKVVFHYGLSETQQFTTAEMTKREDSFELTLTDLLSDTLYYYYYELFQNSGDALTTVKKNFHTLAVELPLPPTPPVVELPTVVTAEVSEITAYSAICGGEVTNDGGAEVTERGICWSENANPTVSDSYVSAGNGIGTFSATMSGLQANTTYHVRAYATNEKGTAYGIDRVFVPISGGGIGDAPIGAINGLFTINANGDQVYFSQGNLQYQASTNTWRFAENQWNYVGTQHPGELSGGIGGGNVEGSDNYDVSEDYDGWIDLFNWGTSGYNHGAIHYHPWEIAGNIGYFDPYGCNSCNLFDYSGQADWGYNAISNGGNMENQWRTLKTEEWGYVINGRSETEARFVKAKVNGVNGVILFPDGWESSIYSFECINQNEADYDVNIIDESDWVETIQYRGAVFLPAAGWRQLYHNDIDYVGVSGRYWASTRYNSANACLLGFGPGGLFAESHWEFYFSSSVRVVQDANR